MSMVDGGHVIMNESMMVSVTDNEVDDIVMSISAGMMSNARVNG